MAETSKHFSVLSLNIQSVIAKIDELVAFVSSLQDIHYKFNVAYLQECWLFNLTDVLTMQLPGYDCLVQGKSNSKNGGLIIILYVDTKLQYEVQLNINTYEYWEGQIIKLTWIGLSKAITIGDIYRPPSIVREHIRHFINEFTTLILSIKK